MVVGSKIDEKRVVDSEEGRKVARDHGALFIETSAKCDLFVKDAFNQIVKKIVSSEHFDNRTSPNVVTLDKKKGSDSSPSAPASPSCFSC
ncbi:GH12044 [Drosophila grimshawi]|uniref:GH12044 n=2 Tax=Drosophila grimshawi TaxID=7222 RepID=B4JKI7_DROGR|nr:GH12044 [Drosophila grimshawi]